MYDGATVDFGKRGTFDGSLNQLLDDRIMEKDEEDERNYSDKEKIYYPKIVIDDDLGR